MKVLITGASSGIGRDMAKYLSEKGCKLILVSRNTDKLKELENTLKTQTEIIQCDLSDEKSVFELYRKCKDKDVDFLINNAGYGLFGEFDKTDIHDELDMINVNIKAVHILTKLFLKDFKYKNHGIILNVASSAGFMTGPLMSSYYASKNYVVRLSLAIREELRRSKSNVKISVFCPGPVDTNFNNRAGVSFSVKSISSEYAARYAIDKCLSGKAVIIPTIEMKLGVIGSKLVPNGLLSAIAYNIQHSKEQN
ncbi:SDR family NAD(P)-dependent oxidoreductase [Porcipelethomonas sp.]|uniref:SDR family NAD(P)-dependent oxidoreductase n=1 Tax=Porcipelethomonas sp. TaxID=2981675 RepID=UPI003EF741E1